MQSVTDLRISEAVWPADLGVATALLRDYRDFLSNNPAGPVNVCLADYARELETLAQTCDGRSATLLLARCEAEAVGCALVRLLPKRAGAAEMKRLYVAPAGRGRGVGRALIHDCIAWARQRGARELLLDTVPEAMPEAVRLYRAFGFEVAERYHAGDIPGLSFFRLPLE